MKTIVIFVMVGTSPFLGLIFLMLLFEHGAEKAWDIFERFAADILK